MINADGSQNKVSLVDDLYQYYDDTGTSSKKYITEDIKTTIGRIACEVYYTTPKNSYICIEVLRGDECVCSLTTNNDLETIEYTEFGVAVNKDTFKIAVQLFPGDKNCMPVIHDLFVWDAEV